MGNLKGKLPLAISHLSRAPPQFYFLPTVVN